MPGGDLAHFAQADSGISPGQVGRRSARPDTLHVQDVLPPPSMVDRQAVEADAEGCGSRHRASLGGVGGDCAGRALPVVTPEPKKACFLLRCFLSGSGCFFSGASPIDEGWGVVRQGERQRSAAWWRGLGGRRRGTSGAGPVLFRPGAARRYVSVARSTCSGYWFIML